jgi:protein ImuB
MSARIACLLVPSFPLAARLRAEPELSRLPAAVLQGSGAAAKVVGATTLARRAGVASGLSAPQARALLPALTLRPRDEPAEAAAQQALLEAAEAFSPVVEEAGPGVAYLDLTGCGDEKAALRSLVRRCGALGLSARAGCAGSRVAARLAARLSAGEPTVVVEGQDRRFLAPLPLGHLRPDERTAKTLERWGLRSIGALAQLPEAQLAARLGKPGWLLRRLALGEDPKPLIPRRKPAVFREGVSLEWTLSELEPFAAAAEPLVQRLCARLEAASLSCRALSLSLSLEPSGADERLIRLAAPTRDARTLLGLLRLELATRPPAAPLSGFALTAEPDRARETQLSLFGPAAPSPDLLSTTIARLCALLGPDRLGSPKTVSGHRPERFAVAPYEPPAADGGFPFGERPDASPLDGADAKLERGRPFCAVRALRPAVPLEVLVGGTPPRPTQLSSLEAEGFPVSGRVVVASGPWRLEEGWWQDCPLRRDYWDVELSDGALYRVYLDHAAKAWFADGLYD